MTNSFFTADELKKKEFKSLGDDVLISRKACFYSPANIEIGSNVRIDDFCILSGKIQIGSFVHIAAYTSLCGAGEGIVLEDFVNISRKVEIFAISDDFSGESMTNPTIPDEYKNMQEKRVILKKHVVIGAGSVILPGVIMEEGSVVGALSLVKESTTPWTINSGIPARKKDIRKKNLLTLEKQFLEKNKNAE